MPLCSGFRLPKLRHQSRAHAALGGEPGEPLKEQGFNVLNRPQGKCQIKVGRIPNSNGFQWIPTKDLASQMQKTMAFRGLNPVLLGKSVDACHRILWAIPCD